MSAPEEKELKAPDAMAAAVQPTNEERHDEPDFPGEGVLDAGKEKAHDTIDAVNDDESDRADETDEKPANLAATKSYATDASVVTTATDLNAQYKARPWYRKMNPLRWGGIPPVPEERIVSREYKAGFFSKLIFQWMAPFMTVRSHFFLFALRSCDGSMLRRGAPILPNGLHLVCMCVCESETGICDLVR